MAVPLYCPNCGDNLGKDVENPKKAFCGNCGQEFTNHRGYTAEVERRLNQRPEKDSDIIQR